MFVKSILFVQFQTVKPFYSNVHVVKSHDVVLQLLFLCKLGFTFRAFEFETVGMRSNMMYADDLSSKLFSTYFALKGFFARVFAMMSLHKHPVFCCIATWNFWTDVKTIWILLKIHLLHIQAFNIIVNINCIILIQVFILMADTCAVIG